MVNIRINENIIIENPAFTEILSGILLYLLKANTKSGDVSSRAVTYPGFGAERRAKVLVIIKIALKDMI